MDAITGAAVAIALWVLLGVFSWALPAILGFFGGMIGESFDKYAWDDSGLTWGTAIGAILGWASAIGLTVLAVVNAIIQIVHLVGLIQAGA